MHGHGGTVGRDLSWHSSGSKLKKVGNDGASDHVEESLRMDTSLTPLES